jgi:hypothetical protein
LKKLSKLTINPSKVMKNEELVNLKGGNGGGYWAACKDDNGNNCEIEVSDCEPQTVRTACDSECSGWKTAACA